MVGVGLNFDLFSFNVPMLHIVMVVFFFFFPTMFFCIIAWCDACAACNFVVVVFLCWQLIVGLKSVH